MSRDILSSRSVQVALVALGAALGVTIWVAARAASIEPVVPAPPPTFATAGALAKPPRGAPVDINGVVAQNAFSPDRRAPVRRFRLTGYATEVAAAPAPPTPVILGTSVASDNRSFAYVSVGDSRATIVRVGDRIGGYTVKSIARGSVTFVTPSGETLVVNAARL